MKSPKSVNRRSAHNSVNTHSTVPFGSDPFLPFFFIPFFASSSSWCCKIADRVCNESFDIAVSMM